MWFIFKNPDSIEMKLFPQFGPEVFSPIPVKHAIPGNEVTDDKNTIVNG